MKTKVLFLLVVTSLLTFSIQAQRGVRIGYIDTEYILQNVPEYQDATTQLEGKVSKWKTEIEAKLSVIDQKRKDLSNEKALLTKELIEEREEDISFEEKEILDYQQKRFGPNGDLMIQKQQLIQPLQDQIFAAVQTIAANKKYDFIFDKSADVVMLFSAKRFDISELVLRSLTRASKREQAKTKAERKAAEKEDAVPVVNEKLEARQKAVEERKQEILDAREAKKKEAQERRKKLVEERAQARQDKLDARNKTTNDDQENLDEDLQKDENGTEGKTAEQLAEEAKQQKLNDREARKKALEERKQKVLAEREAARLKKIEDRKKAKEDRENNNQENEEENK